MGLDPVEVAREGAPHRLQTRWLARAKRSSICFSAATTA
jgi:hypothetical protein